MNTASDVAEVIKAHEYTIEELKVGRLDIDMAVQRGKLRENVVRSIVRDFNPLALGIGTVSYRGGDFYVVLDGAHRVEALRRLTDNEGTFRCRVLVDLSLEEEADIFLQLNSGTQPTPYEKYRVGVTASHDDLIEINKVVHAYGLSVGSVPARGTINAIGQLYRVHQLRFTHEQEDGYEYDPISGVLSMTLKAITMAWGNEKEALQGVMIDGVSRLLEKHMDDPRFDFGRLVNSIKRATPGSLLQQARQYAQLRTIKVGVAMAQLLVDRYNSGLQAGSRNALPNYANR